MRVLLVEDQDAQAAAIMIASPEGIVFDHAPDRNAGLDLIQSHHYDLAICDLKIPPAQGDVADVDHGLAVLTAIRERYPGTPVIAFTAYKTKDVLDLLLREQRQEDFLGTLQERPMLTVVDKDELPEFLQTLEELHSEFDELSKIDLVLALDQQPLDSLTRRVLQLYARQKRGVIVRVERFTGGHSGIPVLRLRLERADGASGGIAVARVADVAAVAEEHKRFQQRVSGILPLGSYAEILGVVRAGAAHVGGVFYQVAEDCRPLFEVMVEDEAGVAEAVRRLHVAHAAWREGAPAETTSVGSIRRILIGDRRWAACASRCGLDLEATRSIEEHDVLIRRSTVHGDLHGENVLVGERPVVIDFASVSQGPTPLDPVSLELSLLFHPHAPVWEGDWPRPGQLRRWHEFDHYVEGCPFPSFVRACREWAVDVARGNPDVFACAYAYLASQARFPTTRGDRLVDLANGLRELFP